MHYTKEQLLQTAIAIHAALISDGKVRPGTDPVTWTKWSVDVAKELLSAVN